MKLPFSHYFKRFGICSLLGLFLFVNVVGVFGFVQPTHAQLVVADPSSAALLGIATKEAAKDVVKETKISFKNALLQSFLSALVQGASYFTRKLAYDGAKWVASGGKGQGALAFKDGFWKYAERTAADAGATAVEEFGAGFGLSLCSLPNINLQLYLQLSIPQLYPEDSYGPSTSCTFSQLQNNWNDEGRRRWREQTSDQLAENFSRSLQVDTNSSDFGIALGAIGNVDRIRASAREANILDRLEGGGFKSVTDFISGNILTPGDLIRYEAKSVTQKDQGALQADQIAGIYGVQALNILPQAGSIFLNTVVSEGLKNLLAKKGLIPQKTPSEIAEDSGPGRATARDIEDAVSFFLKATTPRTGEDIDIVVTMAACPSDSPGLNNCVMDNGLYTALIRESRNQQRLTIAEAIEEGLLNKDWPLIPPTNGLNDDFNCYEQRYCYSNIQKMRKLRILPLGFEVAALRSDPDRPWTLGQVVENFENCGPRNPDESVNPDQDVYPFCHLIDPNWVLREPVSRCEAEVFGPELAGDNTNIRREECVDVSTCVSFDENGKCEQYGYCTREQNVWEIPGEQCDEQFATCETFVDTQTKKASSFLTRTLDADECTSDSVGCRAYSTEKVNGEWVSVATVFTNAASEVVDFKQYGRNRSIFFDKDILAKTCPSSQAGCSAFFLLDKTNVTAPFTYDFVRQNNQKVTVNIKKAPEYLNCYDTNSTTPGIQWPVDESQLPLLSNAAECAQYAPVCLPEEVGCDGYTPVDGNDTVQVPGIIGQNACSAQCVGYAAYKQMASTFEPAKDPLYFIPKDADACSLEYVGCSEFTNLDELARGGESLAYFTDTAYCEKPADAARSNEKVFYTWEGSVASGYVIKTHRLKKVSAIDLDVLSEILDDSIKTSFANVNAPAVPQLSKSEIEAHYARCNEAGYSDLINGGPNPSDADCREFIDEAGNRYYRLMGEVVRVSDQCSSYRISAPVLEIDQSIVTPGICKFAKGLWNDTSCERCMGGGEYRDGACIYNILASESNSCPASANQCRSYTGNFAANVRTVAFFDFEPEGNSGDALEAARGSWTSVPVVTNAVQVVSEAVQVGGSSLQINEDTVEFELGPGEVSTDAGRNIVHTLSFWARGLSQTVRIEFVQVAGTNEAIVGSFTGSVPASIGDNWRRYELGPIAFTGNEGVTTTVRFTRSGSGTYFVDNLRLSRVEDTYAFIKDSWKTAEGYNAPLACDSNPVDAFPGEQLGCTAYTQESDNATVYATGFQNLCREEAIGCRALVDTYNTEEELRVVYNSVCEFDTTSSSPRTCNKDVLLSGATVTLGSCVVEPFATSCLVGKMVIPATMQDTAADGTRNIFFWSFVGGDPSTIFIPADTPTTTPIFLSTHSKYSCDGSKYLGCEIVGLETEALPGNDKSTFVTTTLINSPYIYKDTLCTKAEIGCTEYSTDTGLSYFKDPAVVGSLMCQYSEGDGIRQRAGWYLDGIGRCATASMSEEEVGASSTLSYCRADNDCLGVQMGGLDTKCRAVNKTACYPDYLVGAGEYGLYSNADTGYDGFVGMCPAAQNGCTEFIDRADTNPAFGGNGRPYYTILDDNALEAAAECGGKASLREGCVLFDQTNNPSRLYDTAATYARSEQAAIDLGQYAGAERPSLVSPETTGNLNSNTILKVGRNRECSEWLACRSSIPYTNADGRQEYLCYDYDVCNEADGENCGNFVSNTSTGFGGQYLSQDNYVSRDTSWYGRDYSGYSLFQKYPVADFQSVVFSSIALPSDEQYAQQMKNPFLFYQVPDELLQGVNATRSCSETNGNPKPDWTQCGGNSGGRCFSGNCLYPISGSFPSDFSSTTAQSQYTQFVTYATPNSCKAFPEEDSPFPQTVLIENNSANRLVPPTPFEDQMQRWIFGAKQNKYVTSAVCQDGDCVCDYNKVVYEDGTQDYFSASSPKAESITGYCASGDPNKIGLVCQEDSECARDESGTINDIPGYCVQKERIERRMGTLGFCLEYDLSRPVNGTGADGIKAPQYACLTWLPLEISASRIDTYNQDVLAGYTVSEDAEGGFGQVFCTQSTDYGTAYNVSDLFQLPIYSGVNDGASDLPAFLENSMLANLSSIGELDSKRVHVLPFVADGSATTCDGGDNEDCGFISAFNLEGQPRIVYPGAQGWGENSMNCSGTQTDSRTDYVDFVCDSNDSPVEAKYLYTLMQLWAWRFIPSAQWRDTANKYGTNTRLLRLELGGNMNESYGFHSVSGYSGKRINSFAPNIYDTGTIMHPQRSWGGFAFYRPTFQYNTPDGVTTELPDVVYTDLWSADASQAFLGLDEVDQLHVDAHIYISPIESQLHEANIDKVYFVPMRYPDGEDGVNPALGSREFMIDFTSLRQTLLDDGSGNDLFLFRDGLKQNEDVQRGGGVTEAERNDRKNKEFGVSTNNDGSLFSYVLERNSSGAPCGGLLSHCEYNVDGYSYVDSEVRNNLVGYTGNEQEFELKNRIYKRYVAIFYNNNSDSSRPNFLDYTETTLRPPQITSEDPFNTTEVLCRNGGENWLAIGMDFNEDGQFLGYISRFCHNSADESGIQLATFASFVDSCIQYVATHNENPSGTQKNKAWTDRVWSFAKNQHMVNGFPVVRSDSQTPFGSLPLTYASFVSTGSQYPLIRAGTFDNKADKGIPYRCGLFNGPFSLMKCAAMDNTSYSYVLREGIRSYVATRSPLYDLFSLALYRKSINWLRNVDVEIESSQDNSDTDTTDAEKPQVYSLNPFVCNDEQSGKTCTAGERGYITVNGKNANTRDYNGDGAPDEDKMGTANVPDGTDLIAVGSYQAQVRFFGMADRNHMPIRRVMVRWDESSTGMTPNALGFQKNRKPYCMGENGASGNGIGYCRPDVMYKELTCSEGSECSVASGINPIPVSSEGGIRCDKSVGASSFGNSSRACQEGYFEFQHTYSCDVGDLQENGMSVSQIQSINGDMYSRLKSGYGLSDADRVCVYKPGVQVLDNWGWCNASNIITEVNDVVVSATPKPAGGYSGEYNATNNPLGKGDCDPQNNTAWSYFNGIIIVVPEDALPGNR